MLLDAAGDMRPFYEAVDWDRTVLGPMAEWSPALRNATDLALHTQYPVTLLWGPEFVLVYNAAYVPLIADKHPAALGAPARDVFPEAWNTIGPMMESVFAGEGATWVEDLAVPLERHGRLDEAYFTFSYSAVRGSGGAIEGVMDIASETTRQVVDRRRLATLSRLRGVLGDLDRAEEVAARALPVLRGNRDDLPAVAIRFTADPGPEQLAVDGVVRIPLGSGHQAVLEVRLSDRLPADAAYFEFLRLIASSLAQAIDRARAREADHGIAEALQRSLLTPPVRLERLQLAVRYRPAAQQAQVGGDWYDAFTGPDGTPMLVVGDVTGHDQRAAAAMAQVRNLLRGVAYASAASSPAAVLHALDRAMHGLAVDVYATAILARFEPGSHTLRWSNAGHPPPVLLTPDGAARLLERRPDSLLGLDGPRGGDHTVDLPPGASVVLYTDGLVERRTASLDDGLEWLRALVEGCQALDAEALCDHVLEHVGEGLEDDVALLILRAGPAAGQPPSASRAPGAGSTAVERA
jgi:hypothetical protein